MEVIITDDNVKIDYLVAMDNGHGHAKNKNGFARNVGWWSSFVIIEVKSRICFVLCVH